MKTAILLFLAIVLSISVFAQNLDVIKVPDPKSPGKSIKCGPTGSAKDGSNPKSHLAFVGNPQKNRWDIPDPSEIRVLKIDDLLKGKKSTYRAGTPVEVTAYCYAVKPGGVETCNCGTKAVAFKDTHIELTPSSRKTGEKSRFIVEVTPRLRMMMEDEGVDWSSAALKKEMQGKMVTIQGRLFYDEIHEGEAYATDPSDDAENNWRGTAWEIHPVTSIEVIDEDEDDNMIAASGDEDEDGDYTPILPTSGPMTESVAAEVSSKIPTKSPSDMLIMILLGALLGMIGQGIRIVAGLKKLSAKSSDKDEFNENFDLKQLVLSLLYAAIIGFISGALLAVENIEVVWDKSTILALIGAGYAGVDFLEGFLARQMPNTTVTAEVVTGKAKTPPKEGAVDQE